MVFFVVYLHSDVKGDVQAQGLQLANNCDQSPGIRNCPNVVQPRRQRSHSFAVDCGLVHAGGVEVSDTLDNAALGAAGPGRIFENLLKNGEVAFVEFLVHAKRGVFAGNRHFLEGPIGIGIEILAGRDGWIHIGPVHAGNRRFWLSGSARLLWLRL